MDHFPDFIIKIKDKIADEKIENVLQVLRKSLKNPDLNDEIILSIGRYNDINRDFANGIITYENVLIIRQTIRMSVMNLVNRLTENDVGVHSSNIQIQTYTPDDLFSLKTKTKKEVSHHKHNPQICKIIPISSQSAGASFPIRFNEEQELFDQVLVLKQLPHREFWAIRIEGDSMLPVKSGMIGLGEYYDTELKERIKEGTRHFIQLGDGDFLFKRVLIKNNRSLKLIPDNSDYSSLIVDMSEVRLLLKCKEVIPDNMIQFRRYR